MTESTAAVRGEIVQGIGCAVLREVGWQGTNDELQRAQAPADHAFLGLCANTETHIHTILRPVTHPVIKLDIRLYAGMATAELIHQRPQQRQGGRARADEAQRPSTLILGGAYALQGSFKRIQCRLGCFQKLLAFIGQRDLAGRTPTR